MQILGLQRVLIQAAAVLAADAHQRRIREELLGSRESRSASGAARSMICSGVSFRSERGFRRMQMRPKLRACAPTPTRKSARRWDRPLITAIAACCDRHHGFDRKLSCGNSVAPLIWPVSWLGMKPLGTSPYR